MQSSVSAHNIGVSGHNIGKVQVRTKNGIRIYEFPGASLPTSCNRRPPSLTRVHVCDMLCGWTASVSSAEQYSRGADRSRSGWARGKRPRCKSVLISCDKTTRTRDKTRCPAAERNKQRMECSLLPGLASSSPLDYSRVERGRRRGDSCHDVCIYDRPDAVSWMNVRFGWSETVAFVFGPQAKTILFGFWFSFLIE